MTCGFLVLLTERFGKSLFSAADCERLKRISICVYNYSRLKNKVLPFHLRYLYNVIYLHLSFFMLSRNRILCSTYICRVFLS